MKSILKRPIVTEKMTAANEKGTYGFEVSRKSNKLEIRKAVEDMYNVTVASVRTMNVQGKAKSRYTKAGVISGRASSYKKAIVTVAEGEIIDFYEGI